MTVLFISPQLAPWIEFVPDDVILQDDAPDELKPEFERLRANLKKAQKVAVQFEID